MSALPQEADGRRGPLLVPQLQFLLESSQRKEVHSGSFCGHHNCQLKKDVQLESCELSFIWDKMRTAALEAASQIALRDSTGRQRTQQPVGQRVEWREKTVGGSGEPKAG